MLIKPRFFGFGSQSHPKNEEKEEEEVDVKSDLDESLPHTAIYVKSPDMSSIVYPRQLVEDRKLIDVICRLMSDGKSHSISELEVEASKCKDHWQTALRVIVEEGLFVFEKHGFSLVRFVMRRRNITEPKQLISDLLRGAYGAEVVEVKMVVQNPENSKESKTEIEGVPFKVNEFSVVSDDVLEIGSCPEEKMVLSAREFVTETHGVLARRGAGKTYLAMVLAEELLTNSLQIPFVVLDPTGAWYGLASKADGTPAERAILILGGEHAEIVIEPREGRGVAQVVVQCRPTPVLIDLSSFGRDEQYQFGADFMAALFELNRKPLHIFLDEADTLAPQYPDKASSHQHRSLKETDHLVRRGRTRGLGVTLITQRAAVLNKNVLSQIDSLFYLQTRSPHDLNAISDWLSDSGIPEHYQRECREDLPLLGKGAAYYSRGGEKNRFAKFQVREKLTFDSSATPEFGKSVIEPTLIRSDPGLIERAKSIMALVVSDNETS